MAAMPLDRVEDLPGLKSEAPMNSEESPPRGYFNRAVILGPSALTMKIDHLTSDPRFIRHDVTSSFRRFSNFRSGIFVRTSASMDEPPRFSPLASRFSSREAKDAFRMELS